MEQQIIIYLVEGDNAPDLSVRFTGLDLSTYDTIEMKVKREDCSRFARTVTPDGSDVELGTVTWQAGDLVKGTHHAEFEFTVGTSVFTVPRQMPVELRVRGDL